MPQTTPLDSLELMVLRRLAGELPAEPPPVCTTEDMRRVVERLQLRGLVCAGPRGVELTEVGLCVAQEFDER